MNKNQEKELYEKLKEIISKEHEIKEIRGITARGAYHLETGVIFIKADVEYLQKIKTLLHEYAHAVDFTIHPELEISRNRRELVAESVAFVVSLWLGLDTSRYSISYIRSWLNDKNELELIEDTVQKIVEIMIKHLEESSDITFSI